MRESYIEAVTLTVSFKDPGTVTLQIALAIGSAFNKWVSARSGEIGNNKVTSERGTFTAKGLKDLGALKDLEPVEGKYISLFEEALTRAMASGGQARCESNMDTSLGRKLVSFELSASGFNASARPVPTARGGGHEDRIEAVTFRVTYKKPDGTTLQFGLMLQQAFEAWISTRDGEVQNRTVTEEKAIFEAINLKCQQPSVGAEASGGEFFTLFEDALFFAIKNSKPSEGTFAFENEGIKKEVSFTLTVGGVPKETRRGFSEARLGRQKEPKKLVPAWKVPGFWHPTCLWFFIHNWLCALAGVSVLGFVLFTIGLEKYSSAETFLILFCVGFPIIIPIIAPTYWGMTRYQLPHCRHKCRYLVGDATEDSDYVKLDAMLFKRAYYTIDPYITIAMNEMAKRSKFRTPASIILHISYKIVNTALIFVATPIIGILAGFLVAIFGNPPEEIQKKVEIPRRGRRPRDIDDVRNEFENDEDEY